MGGRSPSGAGGRDRYRRVRRLGEGASGQVWLVEDSVRRDSEVALKELTETTRGREDSLRHEFAALHSLHHPNLVEVHDFDVSPESGLPRFSLEYIEGLDLVTTVQQEGPDSFATLAAESLRALAFLHDYGLVHRDLKPGNLLVRSKARGGCRVVVLDFGLALRGDRAPGEQQKEEEDRDEERSPAQPAGPAGTLPYLAPELFEGTEADHRSDLYGLGAVLFEAIHGRPPFDPEGKDPGEFIQQVRDGRRSRPPVPEGYPAGLAGWLEGLLSPDPADRPAGARDALAGLNDAGGFKLPAELPITRAARLASGRPVGRDLELEQLWSNLSNDERPRLVWLCGDAGSGKTRLARWVAGEAVGRGWDVVVGLSDEQTRDREAADAALRDLRDRAAKRSTLLLIDEAENARSGVVRLLERVAREGKAPPLRVVAALRPVEIQHPAVRKLLADTELVPTLKRVDLQQLDAPGVRAMAERATGNPSISETRLKWLLKTAEGNPLLTEDLLVEGTWEKRGKEKRSAAELLAESVTARLAVLSENGRHLLEALAVLERPSSLDTVAAVAALDLTLAVTAVREVEAAGFCRNTDGFFAPASRSVAARVRKDLNPERRRRLCRRGAEVVEAQDGFDPLQRSLLWLGAGDKERATAQAVAAAEAIDAKRNDPAWAAQAYAVALRGLGRRHERRYEMRLRQAETLFEAGLYPEAVRAAGAAVRLSDDPSQLSAALYVQSQALASSGKYLRALFVAERAIRIATDADNPIAVARGEKAKGTALGRMNRDREAVPALRSAVATLETTPHEHRTWIEAIHTLGVLRDRNLEPDAKALLERAMNAADDSNYPRIQIFARIALSTVLRKESHHDRADLLLNEASEIAGRQKPSALQHLVAFKQAQVALNRDQYDSALQLTRESEESGWHFGDLTFAIRARIDRATALAFCGRSPEGAGLLQETLNLPALASQPGLVEGICVGLAETLMESPDIDHSYVKGLLAKSIESARTANNKYLLSGALLLEVERRSLPGCSEPFEPARREFESLAEAGPLRTEYSVRLTIARARDATKRADWESAADLGSKAVALAAKGEHTAFGIRAMIVQRDALLRLDRRAEADVVLRAARESVRKVAATLSDPDVRRAFLDHPALGSLREEVALEASSDKRLSALYEMIRILNSEQDPEVLLDAMLDMVLRAANAQRGLVLLRDLGKEEPTFSIRAVRGTERETEKDAEQFSRSVVAKAGRGESILAVDAGSDERFRDLRSVSLYHIRSLMCVPLRSRGRIIGTVYLDSRSDGSVFSEADLRFVEAFADHAALALENARSRARLAAENKRLRAAVAERVNFDNIIGRSPAMQRVFDLIEKIAASELPVLIQGESGTGKELVARSVHHHSSRKNKVFLSENCAAIPETLLESELFGHVRGAFTGAERDRAGLFEQAHDGTLFLDEIGDMSPAMQARLLRVLQEGELRRVGGDATIEVDVRVLAATHRDLQQRVKEGSFREDLLYRLQVLTIQLPPLRDRAGDIPRLIDHLVERISRERDREQPEIAPDVMDLLERYAWPGNVRQLENVIQRLALLAGDGAITRAAIDSDANLRDALSDQPPSGEAMFSLERSERDQIQRALDVSEGNRNKAARMLGISRATIYRKIKEYGLR